jgi:RNA polymerase sigma factor (sigma-70 family)
LTQVSYIKDTCQIAGHLSDDLFQHIWVKILEFDQVKLEQIYLKGYLQFYIYRMIVNEARNKNNSFLKSHKHIEFEFTFAEEYDKEQDAQFETNLIKVKSNLEKLFWYDKKIFELYIEFGSLRKVSAKTGIKYGAIHQTIKKVKKQLNENIISR